MKGFACVLVGLLALTIVSHSDAAGFRSVAIAKTVNNPPGLFNREVTKAVSVVRGNGGGGGVSAAAAAGGGVRRGGAAAASAGFGGAAASASAGRGRNFNNGVAVASVGGFNQFNARFVPTAIVNPHGGFVANAGLGYGQQVLFVNQNKVRFNSFGTSTVQDAFGNVYEVDAFGNLRLLGNRLGASAFSGFVPTANAVYGSNFSIRSSYGGCH